MFSVVESSDVAKTKRLKSDGKAGRFSGSRSLDVYISFRFILYSQSATDRPDPHVHTVCYF